MLAAVVMIILIMIIIDIIKGSSVLTPGFKEGCYSTGFPEDKLESNHYVKLVPNVRTSISLISQLAIIYCIHVLFSLTSDIACYGLNCVPSKRCSVPNPQYVRTWPHLETGSL